MRRAVELRLRHRLEDFSRDLEQRAAEAAAPPGRAGNLGAGPLARDALAAAASSLVERHAELALRDLQAFLAEAGDEAVRPWLVRQLDDHVSQTVRRTLAALGVGDEGRVARATALRNRLTNLEAAIRARGHATLVGAPVSFPPMGADEDEQDDRLPLRRRRGFDRDLQESARQCATSGQPLGLVMIDLDLFKSVNDTHGHPTGDEVLQVVSQRVVQRLGRKGRAYRYGGEELALLLPGYSWEEALGLAERLRKDIAAAPMTGKGLLVTASFGVASIPDDAPDGAALLQRADQALYAAKRAGRNCARAAADLPAADLDPTST